jgi:hypothetical protein
MPRRKTLREKVEKRIARKGDAVFLPREFFDLGGEDQILRALRELVREGRLIRLGYRVHARAEPSKLTGQPILAVSDGFVGASIGGSANRNSIPQLTEIDHCVEITFLQDVVIDAVDVDEDRSEGVVARFRNAADLAIDLRDHGTL